VDFAVSGPVQKTVSMGQPDGQGGKGQIHQSPDGKSEKYLTDHFNPPSTASMAG
jgi:hypothetical protein